MRERFVAAWLVVLLLIAQNSVANPLIQDVTRVLRVDEVVFILRDEGLQYGASLERDMLGGQGGRYFQDRVSALYEVDKIGAILREVLDETLDANQMEAIVTYFDTELGQRILSLENAGRVAMADPAVEQFARESYADLADGDVPHFAEVERFVRINDLIERNVVSAMEANYHFYRGFVDGDGARMGERDMLAEVWAGEADLRADTTSWIYGFLLMAYQPLDLEELRSYSDFSETPAGQALNRALFKGFDRIYNDISYELGLAVAQALNSSDI
jgi:hypothetical protein